MGFLRVANKSETDMITKIFDRNLIYLSQTDTKSKVIITFAKVIITFAKG